MKACSNFVAQEWKKHECRNCFQKKDNHSGSQATITADSTVSSSMPDKKLNSLSPNKPNRKFSKHDDEFHTTLPKPPSMNRSRTSDTTESNVLSVGSNRDDMHSSELIPCRYGVNCYRRNPTHFEKYSHPIEFIIEPVAVKLVTGLSSEQEIKLHDTIATGADDLDQKNNNEISSEMIANLEEQLLQQQYDLQKHIRLADERLRASMTDSEVKLKKYEEQIETLQSNLIAMATYHQQLEDALGDELDKREKRELEKKRILSIKRDTPSYWGPNAFEQPYREVDIQIGSAEFNIISQLLNDTIAVHDHKFGTIYRKDPTEFIVMNIHRVQNDKLWHEYCFKKEQIIERHNRNLKACASSKYLENYPFLTPLLDINANEYWLFHGCDQAILPFLLHSGYDPRVSSLDGMFGGGFYLAENSSKSNQYIPCPGCGANSIFTGSGCKCHNQENIKFSIVLYRAVLGDVHIAREYDKKKYRGEKGRRVRRPPLKDNGILHDSVLGESMDYGGNLLKYREVILYECGQAYPEYVIEFRRSAENSKPPAGVKKVKDRCYDFLRNTFKLRPE
ncbi:unnamed protein product [Rotaria socialis]|uniref:Poly [ADP-ribose] polymerase n=3 Tax=Rotaria socialis TaxID=392032 RepID=A0A819BSZ1_9BILA|nr:unnamed protein product [Rotaria socialis]CAF4866195.1 unnamed protein product [Rotaria socialis]